MTKEIGRDTFVALVGRTVEARTGSADRVPLEVEQVEDRDGGAGHRFSVFFTGPGDVVLPQATYPLDAPWSEDPLIVFIVPIARDGDRVRYEAVFNRLPPRPEPTP